MTVTADSKPPSEVAGRVFQETVGEEKLPELLELGERLLFDKGLLSLVKEDRVL